MSFELFKEKCGFLVELVTKNDEKWGTPGFFLGFLSLFRLKIWKRFQYLEFLSKIVLEFWISWVFFSLSFCNFVKKKSLYYRLVFWHLFRQPWLIEFPKTWVLPKIYWVLMKICWVLKKIFWVLAKFSELWGNFLRLYKTSWSEGKIYCHSQ